ncbi:hypothetical protein THASP1DRAFT_22562 [Thamnocephalis sphaerospora]|uniref:Inositol hexakisphosphate and diphosphoinositol-pentakisphosphate kinase n=1 Tax=Thamnocephalis sphaerospora TaxID=78915 RepID=A0A4P9XVH7_9FUNG|nr:hypothetical protein THASP1DRAFT_22562 [Thamnocephalis sphaerospora]|eukprot:RKP09611.1 hypothetical protein THASP1DRAFT_22562 [Thamnocephalis sphaerospora]
MHDQLNGKTGSNEPLPPSSQPTQPSPSMSPYIVGICAMHKKARSKPMTSILSRLRATGHFEIIYFEENAILHDAVETWPLCDFLVAFYSTGFPLDKAIAYAKLRRPYCVNDLRLQEALRDRRLVLKILDANGIPTAPRIVVSRDHGPIVSPELSERLRRCYGVNLNCNRDHAEGRVSDPDQHASHAHAMQSNDDDGNATALAEEKNTKNSVIHAAFATVSDVTEDFTQVDDDTIQQDGYALRKPFVEKPVDGDDHNVRIYYASSQGGGARCLFRKVGNKSSEFRSELSQVRMEGSYIYEQFMRVDNAEDVKVYTVGASYAHAETRKSPVVDGEVVRDASGKEIRRTTPLSDTEKEIARKVCRAFGQTICGFDLLRVGGQSYVIDVNGWSFVKGNEAYYDRCACILQNMLLHTTRRRRYSLSLPKGTGLDNM